VLHAAAGAVTESDVLLSSASEGLIVAFDTNVEAGAQRQADAQGVAVRTYDIIYELVDDVEKALKGLLEPEEREVVLGHATVQAVFPHGRREKIAGVRVTDGTMRRNAKARVKRKNEVVFEGSVDSMRHLKENVRELATNFEGGIKLDGFDSFEEGDIIESFEIRIEER
jgi:translation initiation factor IF-2